MLKSVHTEEMCRMCSKLQECAILKSVQSLKVCSREDCVIFEAHTLSECTYLL